MSKEITLPEESQWRAPFVTDPRLKLTDERKQVYLDVYRKTGRRGVSARAASVTTETIRLHEKRDPVFRQAVEAAWQERCDDVVGQLEEQGLLGHDEKIITGEGENRKERTRRVYETPIRMAMLKRHEPEYKEKSENAGTGGGGVLVVPIRLSPEEWEMLYSPKPEEELLDG